MPCSAANAVLTCVLARTRLCTKSRAALSPLLLVLAVSFLLHPAIDEFLGLCFCRCSTMALTSTLNRFYQRAKNIIHAVQALLIFVALMITVAIFTKGGQSDSRITYNFVLCLMCIPVLIYQTAFPTFQRSKRFANAYAHATIDLLLTILWFAAFLAELVWAKDGTEAAKDFKSGDSICQVFGYGPTDECHLGQVAMIFGIAIW